MATAKASHALTTYFENKHEERFGRKPFLNRYKARWGWDAILDGMKADDVKELIDYYFTTSITNGDLDWFFYNYEKLRLAKHEHEKDQARVKELLRASQKRTQEWKAKIGKLGDKPNQLDM